MQFSYMKRLSALRLLLFLAVTMLCAVLLSSCQEKKYRIAVSQSFNDDWHNQLTQDIKIEASTHTDMKFVFRQANSSVEQQIKDVEKFIEEGMDLLIISPNGTKEIESVIEKVYDLGIPVILVDSRIKSGKYTASIGADNFDIGERAGSYAVYLLKGKGKILEVRGQHNTSTAIDRHRGFADALQNFPDIVIADSCECDWNYKDAYTAFEAMLTRHPDVDLVAAANDIMAQAVYDVCVEHQLVHLPYIMGVDGICGAGKGVSNILDGKLTATCTNPTGGIEIVNLAECILEGRPYERNTLLKTTLIFASNANLMTMMNQQRTLLNKKIEDMNGDLYQSLRQINYQRMLLILAGIICLMLLGLIYSVRRHHKIQAELRQKVDDATKSKLNFFSNVSHSFRTPLTLIADPIQQLIREGGLTIRQQELLELMKRNTDQLLDLSGQVLNVLKKDMINDGEQLDAVAQDAVNRYQKIVEFRNSRLKNQVHPELLNEAETGPQTSNDEAETNASARDVRPSVLIIDDNPDVRQYITLIFESEYIVLQANDGQEGLQMAQENIPDLIICDVLMPVMDGLECSRKLKEGEATSHIPIIMLTAYGLDDQRILGYKSGVDAYITKPFNTDVLRARVKNLLENRRRINASQDRNDEMARLNIGAIDRSLVEHFHDFIVKNLQNTDLGIQDLCEEFNMSRVQVYRKFKSLTGQPPVELIRIIRLKHARQLLETTGLTVSEVAFEAGFSSPSYFAKCYRDQFNETPTDVQRRVREGK